MKLLDCTLKVHWDVRYVRPWSSLDKGEVTGLPDNLHIQQKHRFFERHSFSFYLKNNQAYCWMWTLTGKPVTPLYLKSSMVLLGIGWRDRQETVVSKVRAPLTIRGRRFLWGHEFEYGRLLTSFHSLSNCATHLRILSKFLTYFGKLLMLFSKVSLM